MEKFRENSLGIFSPGQGVQQAGMGEEAFSNSDEAKEVFYVASEVTGLDMTEVCFGSQTDRLDETLVAQPAIAAVTIAEYRWLERFGIRFDAGKGHSMGEIPLLCMAGSLALRQTFEVLQLRAEVTSKANEERPGVMSAFSGLTREQVEQKAAHLLAGARIAIANSNGTLQQVFSGDRDLVEELEELFKNMKIKERLKVGFTRLRTGGAFHSPYHMEKAAIEFRDGLRGVNFSAPAFELMLNNARYLSEVGTENLDVYLSQQLVSPVDFVGGVNRLVADGVKNYIEVGPLAPGKKHKTLSGLVKREFDSVVNILEVSEISNSNKRNSRIETAVDPLQTG